MMGWVKMYRELLDKPIFLNSTPIQWKIMTAILLMANHKSAQWDWAGKKFSVEPGQFITSFESIRKACGDDVSIQNVRTAMVRFEKLQFLTRQSTSHGQKITITNWDTYQHTESDANKASNTRVTCDQHAPNMRVTTNKKEENEIMKRKDSLSSPDESEPKTDSQAGEPLEPSPPTRGSAGPGTSKVGDIAAGLVRDRDVQPPTGIDKLALLELAQAHADAGEYPIDENFLADQSRLTNLHYRMAEATRFYDVDQNYAAMRAHVDRCGKNEMMHCDLDHAFPFVGRDERRLDKNKYYGLIAEGLKSPTGKAARSTFKPAPKISHEEKVAAKESGMQKVRAAIGQVKGE